MKNIKLIACDLDGTLLNSERRVSENTKKAVQKVMAAGKMFIIATGRMFIAAKPFADQLELDVPIVTYNGALIRGSKSGKIFLEQPIKLETAQEVLDYVKEKNLHTNFYVGDTLYVHEHNEKSFIYGEMQGIHECIKALGDAFYTASERPNKMLLMVDVEAMPTIMAELKEHFKEKLYVTSSYPGFVELMEPGVNKWQAIQRLAAQYDIKPEEIMCIGDSGNDYEMVANAGFGVAMGNADDHVKAAAKMVSADNNHDGVALALEELLKD